MFRASASGGSSHLLVEDHATTGAAQGLVGGCGDNVCVFKRRRDCGGGNEPGYVGHVCEHDRTDAGEMTWDKKYIRDGSKQRRRGGAEGAGEEELRFQPVANGANALVVDEPRVCGGASNNQLRSVKQGCDAKSRKVTAG